MDDIAPGKSSHFRTLKSVLPQALQDGYSSTGATLGRRAAKVNALGGRNRPNHPQRPVSAELTELG